MNLAAVLGFCLLSWGFWASLPNPCLAQAAQPPAASGSSSQSQSTTTSPAPASAPKSNLRKAHRKTKPYADCSTAPTALNPNGASADSAKTATPTQSTSAATTPATADTGNSAKTPAGSNTAAKPCPPKKIVRNGGADEPDIQLLGGTTSGKAASERSTEELTAATEENLKKISGRELSSTEQETLAQIKQFMEQSKQAVASGDSERGHDLAQKARLLSDELVKP
jgi:hypothetical protein